MSEKTAEKDTALAIPPIHPLLSREIRPFYSWNEWRARWEAAVSFEEMLGLLHAGFTVRLDRMEHGEKEYDSIDRLIFYFTVADGWENHSLLKLPGDRTHGSYVCHDDEFPSKRRQQVAQKAFDMLCLHFFKEVLAEGRDDDNGFRHNWKERVVSERLFPVIQNFFRAEKSLCGYEIKIRNLSQRQRYALSHNEQHAVSFLLALARIVWGWEREPRLYRSTLEQAEKFEKRNAVLLPLIDGSKPWLIEVLAHLGELDLLREREWLLALDKPSIAKMKEIALRNELRNPVMKSRPVATIEEALYAGSKTALLLKEYEVVQTEHKRLTAIRDAERQKTEAEKSIEKLTAIKK